MLRTVFLRKAVCNCCTAVYRYIRPMIRPLEHDRQRRSFYTKSKTDAGHCCIAAFVELFARLIAGTGTTAIYLVSVSARQS